MHWSQIKSLLILSFFILDIYLFAQFLEKKEQADIGVLEHQSSTVEEQLAAESITFRDLPEEEYEETFISVEQHLFKASALKKDKPKLAQDASILNGSIIASKLEKPKKVGGKSADEITEIFNDFAHYPEEYKYWNWNEEYNVLIFFQSKMERPVYYNQNGVVLAFMNNKNEITSYVQTMLGETESLADKRQLIKPLTAIETVYEEGELYPGDEISKVSIGFHTRVPFEGGVQVFAPTWKVDVNGETDYFVNAIEGFIFSTEEEEFISEVIESIVDKTDITGETDSSLRDITDDLKKRLD